ncbi:SRSF protein kinase 1 [Stomoxys calcitrans]|uniref:SRSF protein kinase 1 n=1 Tax=Stomoxys calcitrans TaxID=35570 RepID=UPI0027E31603|nr:SRSF protein kinase 1 [Stomoxys calcitrans]XP_059226036.1 SRSF protein kinase 1 [Stomoxys calcitrans]
MNNKADVNRRVLAIQAKKKRHKPNKKRGKANGNAGGGGGGGGQQHMSQNEGNDATPSPSDAVIANHLQDDNSELKSPGSMPDVCGISSKISKSFCAAPSSSGSNSLAGNTPITGSSNTLDESVTYIGGTNTSAKKCSTYIQSSGVSNDEYLPQENYLEHLNHDDYLHYHQQQHYVDPIYHAEYVKKQQIIQQQQEQQQQLYQYPPRSSSNDSEESELNSENEEQELKEDYCKGGYHPVNIGDLFQGRYHVVRKLGWGHFSTVWLCWDLQEKRYVAIKIVKSAQHFAETARDEIKILKSVRDSDPNNPRRQKTVQLLDDFKITGVNGTHICMVFEVLGDNLLKLIRKSNYRGIPIENVKTITRQVLEGLDYLHTCCKIIHTDIKPENVLLCVNENYVRKLANEATELYIMNFKMYPSFVSRAPKEYREPQITGKMSKNKKRKLKKKAKKRLELFRKQWDYLEQSGTSNEQPQDANVVKGENEDGVASLAGKCLQNGDASDVDNDEDDELQDDIAEEKAADADADDDDEHAMEEKVGQIKPKPSQSNNGRHQQDEAETTNAGASTSENKKKKKKKNKKKSNQQQQQQQQQQPQQQNEKPEKTVAGNSTTSSSSGSNTLKGEQNDSTSSSSVTLKGQLSQTANECGQKQKKQQQGQQQQIRPPTKPKNNNNKTNQKNSNQKNTNHSQTQQQQQQQQQQQPQQLQLHQQPHQLQLHQPIVSNGPPSESEIRQSKKDPALEACDFDVKIADLGNACWVDKHFTEDIQTRQYRSLEVILGAGYDTSADIWSTACMAFELATGDYLFEPHSGDNYSRDEDHIAHIIELLGPIPPHIVFRGAYATHSFNRKGELRNITGLRPWGLVDVLHEKYEWSLDEAEAFAEFLKPMLQFDPAKRATAAECLKHPWLRR